MLRPMTGANTQLVHLLSGLTDNPLRGPTGDYGRYLTSSARSLYKAQPKTQHAKERFITAAKNSSSKIGQNFKFNQRVRKISKCYLQAPLRQPLLEPRSYLLDCALQAWV